MPTILNPYLNFRDNAKEAMDFYHSVFGGDLTRSTFAEFQMSEDPADRDKIMHSMLRSENGLILMAADTPSGMDYSPGNNISLSLSGEDESQLRGYWDQLAGGGTVSMPLDKAPWGDSFGMLVDRFGVTWLVNINQTQPAT